MGGCDHKLHIHKTRAGMEAAKASGVRIGAELKLTPEVIEKAWRLLGSGFTVEQTAQELNLSKGSLYGHGITSREARRRAREALNVEEPSEPLLRLVK
jgi:DNA invertase Pin-like site-specific DNA recombinase